VGDVPARRRRPNRVRHGGRRRRCDHGLQVGAVACVEVGVVVHAAAGVVVGGRRRAQLAGGAAACAVGGRRGGVRSWRAAG
jgi:hypothetical protein